MRPPIGSPPLGVGPPGGRLPIRPLLPTPPPQPFAGEGPNFPEPESTYGGGRGPDVGGAYGGRGPDVGRGYGGQDTGESYGGGQSQDVGGAYGGGQGQDVGGAYGGGQSQDVGGAYGGGQSQDVGGAYGGGRSQNVGRAYSSEWGQTQEPAGGGRRLDPRRR